MPVDKGFPDSDNPFNLSKVLEIKGIKESQQKEILEYHYKQANMRIRDAYNNYQDYCYYRVHEFVSRLPVYDSIKVAKKLVKLMRRQGYQCKIIYESNIYFQWKPKERPRDHIPFISKALRRRIELEARQNNDYLFYEVPSILPEFPWYDPIETAEVVAKMLSQKGFMVKIKDNILFICWNKKELEKKSNVKINFETKEEKRQKAIEQIELINENRYGYFINPKRNKKSNIDFDETRVEGDDTNKFDVNRVLHLY